MGMSLSAELKDPQAGLVPILGWPADEPFDALLARLAALPAWRPFDPRALAFVERFSQRLLTTRAVRQHPELMALGHWFRGAHLRRLAEGLEARPDAMVLGRGLAFHVAPSNVDSVFLYSCLISLLAGNANLVRLSRKPNAALQRVTEVLAAVLDEDVGREVAGRIVLLSYGHDAAITQAISAQCLLRVVWGGDATVAALRAVPLRPTAVELCFANRFSAAALGADAVLQADHQAFDRLVRHFADDAFWFDQQACSSPRWLAWIGDDAAVDAAQARFWPALRQLLQRRLQTDAVANTGAMAMDRLTAVFEYAAGAHARPAAEAGTPRIAFPQRLAAEQGLHAEHRARHCGNGLFLEQRAPTLVATAAQFADRDQTLAVYGIGRAELEAFVLALGPRAIDRIVPVGQALAFSSLWDGQDLFTAFTRRILITLPA